VKATVAERADRTTATVRHPATGVTLRTAAARPAAPGGRAAGRAGQEMRAARKPRPALRLVAADGRLVPQPPAAGQASDRAGPARKPVRLTRRGRIVVTAAAMLAIGAASIVVAGAAQATGHAGAPAGRGGGLARVEIRQGESLWTVAEAYDPDADTRVVISEILQMNSLTSDQVQPGQVLWVPRG
jgi:LysM domain